MRESAPVVFVSLVNLLQQQEDAYTDIDIQIKCGTQISDVYIQASSSIDNMKITHNPSGQGPEKTFSGRRNTNASEGMWKVKPEGSFLESDEKSAPGVRPGLGAGAPPRGGDSVHQGRGTPWPSRPSVLADVSVAQPPPGHLLPAPRSWDVPGNSLQTAEFHPATRLLTAVPPSEWRLGFQAPPPLLRFVPPNHRALTLCPPPRC